MKQSLNIQSVLLILIQLRLIIVDGASIWEKYLPSGISNMWKLADMVSFSSDSPISDVLLRLVNEFREGLKAADGEHLSIPDFDWNVRSPNLNGVVSTREMLFTGLTDFSMNNLTTSIMNRTVDIDIGVPFADLHGKFSAFGYCSGFPVWGSGNFSIKLVKIRAIAGAQLMGSSSSVSVSTPRLSVQQIDITLDGLYSNIVWYHFVIILISIISVIVAISVFATLHLSGFRKRMATRKGSYRAVV